MPQRGRHCDLPAIRMERYCPVLTVNGASRADLKDLLTQLDTDRAWLLQQIDSGRWPELRLDLAALERELGQMISRAGDLMEEAESR